MRYRNLSTFSLAPLLAMAVNALPERHYVKGHGSTAARITTRFPAEAKGWKECKTERAARAALTRRTAKTS